MDAFWAKDVLELFRLERRVSFQRFADLVLAQSGAIFLVTRFARSCEVSRQTITNYLTGFIGQHRGWRDLRREETGRVNLVVAADVHQPFEKRFGPATLRFVGLDHLSVSLQTRSEATRR